MEQKVVDYLEDKSSLICHLKYSSPCVLLLQMIDSEDNESSIATPGCKSNIDK